MFFPARVCRAGYAPSYSADMQAVSALDGLDTDGKGGHSGGKINASQRAKCRRDDSRTPRADAMPPRLPAAG